MTDDIDYHTRQIERHAAMIRGEDLEPAITPDDYRIPSGQELMLMRDVCSLSVKEVASAVDKSPGHIYNIEYENNRPGSHLIVSLLRLYRRHWPDDPEVDA